MKALNSVEFLRLRTVLSSMVTQEMITKEEYASLLTKAGYVMISESEFHAPDGSILRIYENK